MNELSLFLLPTSLTDLNEVYNIDASQLHPPLSSIKISSKIVDIHILPSTHDGTKLVYCVQLFALIDEPKPILDRDLERWLCDNRQLRGRPLKRARVAVRVNLFIRDKFQAAGLATYICKKEENYFRSWGAKEVQVFAMEMGRWVWTRPRFGYQVDAFEFKSAQLKYKEWQRARGILPVVEASRLSDFPKEFLLNEVNSLSLYKVL
ncbi:MAG: hypothetical protein ACRECH_12620 [Nitrososphaerales archaeon]